MRAVSPLYIRSIPFHHTLLNNQVFMAQFMKEHISNLYSLKYNYNFEIYITYMDYNIYNNIKLNNIVLETELFSIGNENRGNKENNESSKNCESCENCKNCEISNNCINCNNCVGCKNKKIELIPEEFFKIL